MVDETAAILSHHETWWKVLQQTVSHPEEIWVDWFQLGNLRDPQLTKCKTVITFNLGFKCTLLILCKILWHALNFCLLLSSTEVHWRYHIILCLKKCVFHLHLTFMRVKDYSLFLYSMWFFKRTLRSRIITSFFMFFCQQQNFLLTTKLFCLRLFTFSDAA